MESTAPQTLCQTQEVKSAFQYDPQVPGCSSSKSEFFSWVEIDFFVTAAGFLYAGRHGSWPPPVLTLLRKRAPAS